ncbi:MAG: 50S ribosomal protein L24 [Deltaproteobacteria bacterium]|jgi:large subunit ribosomal protein L24|nr:50S ribosomal protein L24 [Deltaproteobacteria bacterium]
MALKKSKRPINKHEFITALRKGDKVMVIAGGNSKREDIRGKVGKIMKFLPKKNRVFVEGVKLIKRHQKSKNAQESSRIVTKEAGIHISNVMYYVEELKRPVRLRFETLEDGQKVRGYTHPETKKFEQIA